MRESGDFRIQAFLCSIRKGLYAIVWFAIRLFLDKPENAVRLAHPSVIGFYLFPLPSRYIWKPKLIPNPDVPELELMSALE